MEDAPSGRDRLRLYFLLTGSYGHAAAGAIGLFLRMRKWNKSILDSWVCVWNRGTSAAGSGELNPGFRTGGHSVYSTRNILIDSVIRDTWKLGANDAYALWQSL